jgi:hypothetical protein
MSPLRLNYQRAQPPKRTNHHTGLIALLLAILSILCPCGLFFLHTTTHGGNAVAEISASIICLLSLVLSFVFSSLSLRERGTNRLIGAVALAIASIWSVALYILLFP